MNLKKEEYLNKRQLSNIWKKTTNKVVVYTRVSTKEQFDTNHSIEVQTSKCQEYATKKGLTINKYFGGTYESAKTDIERKEFQKMLNYVRKNKNDIKAVLVYDYSRFSRSLSSIGLLQELKNLSIEVISVTQPLDSSTATGRIQQAFSLIFAAFDNEQKSERTKNGMYDLLSKGIWTSKFPVGYFRDKNTGKVTVTKDGHLITKAFEMRASYYTVTEIAKEMRLLGLKLDIRRWNDIFKNILYAGKISHRFNDYDIIDGIHPAITSEEIWKKANEIRLNRNLPVQKPDESDKMPLRGFIVCKCGRKFTAYEGKKNKPKKNRLFYYKCNNHNCNTNIRTVNAESDFLNFIKHYQLDTTLETAFIQLLNTSCKSVNKYNKDKQSNLKRLIDEANKKLVTLEKKYLYNDFIDGETYKFHKEELLEERTLLQYKLTEVETGISNPEEFIQFSTYITSNLVKLWENGSYNKVRKL